MFPSDGSIAKYFLYQIEFTQYCVRYLSLVVTMTGLNLGFDLLHEHQAVTMSQRVRHLPSLGPFI